MKTTIEKYVIQLLENRKKLNEINADTSFYDKQISFLTQQFKNGKKYMEDIEEYYHENRFKTLEIKDKEKYWNEHNCFPSIKYTDTVTCIHCGDKFPVSEYCVEKDLITGNEYICCKNHKTCSGTLIDFTTDMEM